MITELVAKNYGCLQDVTLPLRPLHALIGPNDSGKSTLLRALRTLGQLAQSSFSLDGDSWTPFDPGFDQQSAFGHYIALTAKTSWGTYSIERNVHLVMGRPSGGVTRTTESYDVERGNERGTETQERELTDDSSILHGLPGPHEAYGLAKELESVYYLALSEDGLRRPSGFLPKGQRFLSPHGEGLPGVYFALRNDREEAFERILASVRELFPTVKTVRTQPRSTTELELEIELHDGTRVRAPHISTGLLYYLAFAAIPEFLGWHSTILLEEPENGLHPARIRQVLAVLRAIVEKNEAQVILTTHSPLVINELAADEVTVVTRPSTISGTVVTPISETPNFEKRAGVYALGELWLSYADGTLEAPLFDPKAR